VTLKAQMLKAKTTPWSSYTRSVQPTILGVFGSSDSLTPRIPWPG